MKAAPLLLIPVLLGFSVLTALALRDHGYLGIFTWHFGSTAGLQVLTDLVIACALAGLWIIQDARQRGANPWPWVLLTLTLGSFGPLLYLLRRQWPAR